MQDRIRHTTFGTLVLILATIGMSIVLFPFWKSIFWAVVLAILFWPVRQVVVRRLRGRKTIASILIVLLVMIFVLIPAILIAGLIVDGAATIVEDIRSGAFRPGEFFSTVEDRLPRTTDFLKRTGVDFEAVKKLSGQAFFSVAQFAASHVAVIGQSASVFVFHVVLTLYILFALLQQGDNIYGVIFSRFPASRHAKEKFFAAFSGMAVATIKGMVSVGIVQAVLGGAIFAVLGINSAVFWGALMGLLSVVPPFGASVIWAPAALVMVLHGDTSGGLILLAYGVAVVSMSDNVVRPIVVGRASSVPGYMVLVTTLGGLAMFGLTGLVLGPVIASLFLSAWQWFDESERQTSLGEPTEADVRPAAVEHGPTT
ncbi:AI-2E family transporter [Tropicimonas isoalkanivorans]|uniref:Predicted PurR-regulated permease PerM n=1 Tax=Tropicimonas isoalkanivorans TaxID=441112 RepID=A0A1I1DG08_9RHOB|nr:AI-2E family transporter [Tropicimonas isoalkanivorans]SFB73871.1 Predicted PurR-regulated permease PerM [Tropicimonas isoalkanivorans]